MVAMNPVLILQTVLYFVAMVILIVASLAITIVTIAGNNGMQEPKPWIYVTFVLCLLFIAACTVFVMDCIFGVAGGLFTNIIFGDWRPGCSVGITLPSAVFVYVTLYISDGDYL